MFNQKRGLRKGGEYLRTKGATPDFVTHQTQATFAPTVAINAVKNAAQEFRYSSQTLTTIFPDR